jgi:hypothetical protein
MYQEAQTHLLQSQDALQKEIPYSRRLGLGLLFNVPIDGTLTADFIRGMQAASQSPANSQQVSQPAAPQTLRVSVNAAQRSSPDFSRRGIQ